MMSTAETCISSCVCGVCLDGAIPKHWRRCSLVVRLAGMGEAVGAASGTSSRYLSICIHEWESTMKLSLPAIRLMRIYEFHNVCWARQPRVPNDGNCLVVGVKEHPPVFSPCSAAYNYFLPNVGGQVLQNHAPTQYAWYARHISIQLEFSGRCPARL